MAVPRPVLLALLGFALIVSALLATRGVGGNETVTAPTTPAVKPHPVQAPKHAAKPKVHKSTAAKKHAAAPRHKAPAHKAAPKPAPGAPKAASGKLPTGVSASILPVVRALGRNQVVVLFFSQSGSADDAMTSAGVQALKGKKGVSVFNVGIAQLAAYRPILANVGISQVPAVVVVRPGHKAQLLQGFTDKGSLQQAVADALQ
jgi:hypothetical protein